MDAPKTDRRRELIRHVFPELRYGGDPDIERYFEYRRGGRLGDALAIYNGPLRRRYPDDPRRVLLLRLYREGDPRWLALQDELILELGEKIARVARANIDVLVAPLVGIPQGNAYRALGAVEALLRLIPGEDEDAAAYLARYMAFSTILGHRTPEMDKARRLVDEYLAMSRADAPSEYDFIARSAALEARRRETAALEARGRSQAPVVERYDFIARSEALEERRKKEAEAKSRFFDLSKIKFSAQDRARVEILPSLTRREDKVLAYCWKYWDLVKDPGFERLCFLYSKKYGTIHNAIFRAVKLGRTRGSTDDEILTAVSSILSTSYSYSVSGDLYMQANWRRLKARAEAERIAVLEAAAGRVEARSRGGQGSNAAEERLAVLRAAAPRAEAEPPRPTSRPAVSRVETLRSTLPPSPSRTEELLAARERARAEREASVERRVLAAPSAPAASPDENRLTSRPAPPPETHSAGLRTPTKPPASSSARLAPPQRPQAVIEALPPRGGSVSDRIRKLSGKAYDVYRQLFLEGVRADIHRTLLASRTKKSRLFDDSANAAEDIVFAFLSGHYADPYMDWEASPERAKVEALGFALPSLDPIIEAWYRRI